MAKPKGDSALDKICARTQTRIALQREELPLEVLQKDPMYKRKPRDFRRALLAPGPRVIAEVKFASPSKGTIYPGEASADEAVKVAGQYLSAGAAAISVLTEPEFFKGDVQYLRRVREKHPEATLLMKDFFLDAYQMHLARWAGADAILLIVAAVGRRLPVLLETAQDLGLYALVEVHTEDELIAARRAGAVLIGVNCRDLKTLATDLDVARRLAKTHANALTLKGQPTTRPQAVLIAESGMSRRGEIDELAAEGYRGFLVGSSLMQTGRPGEALKALLEGG
ncbi:MAG: indole-3-glycerol-phosphate synthase [Elusimicrobia bacterium]|nr:indole-3-glycerol-phosphate synthase [Elusimicrobiota bacterium]